MPLRFFNTPRPLKFDVWINNFLLTEYESIQVWYDIYLFILAVYLFRLIFKTAKSILMELWLAHSYFSEGGKIIERLLLNYTRARL